MESFDFGQFLGGSKTHFLVEKRYIHGSFRICGWQKYILKCQFIVLLFAFSLRIMRGRQNDCATWNMRYISLIFSTPGEQIQHILYNMSLIL